MNWWDNFVNGFSQFWNAPVPIIGFTVGTVVIGILAIVSRTSIGKKALNILKGWYDELKDDIHTAIIMFREYKENKEKEIAEMKEHYEHVIEEKEKEYKAEVAELRAELNKMKDFMLTMAQNNPNIRVKKALEEYKDGKE